MPSPSPSLISFLLHLLFLLLSREWPSFSTAVVRSQDDDLRISIAMEPSEKEILLQLMESMSSDREWRSSTLEVCKTDGGGWPGIECNPAVDGRLHVTRLDFGNPPNPTCKKNAIFPSKLFSLPFLQSIFFINCFSSTTKNTTLFFPDKPFSSLQQISLRSNPSLVGEIPARISSLVSLQVLTLSQNRLSGRVSPEITRLKKLVHLDLSYNSLSGEIPLNIGRLRSISGLDLSYNFLSGPIPAGISELGLLQKLDLSSNSLSGSIPESFANLDYLSFLALSNNRLSGELPRSLARLRNIQYIIVEGNPAMAGELPDRLGELNRLQELRLANSGFRGPIPASFGGLVNLTTLSLENNRLTGGIPPELGGLSRIYHMNLSKNLLVGMVPFDEGFLKRLGRNLDLSGNPGLCFRGEEGIEAAAAAVGIGFCSNASNGSSSTAMLRPWRSATAGAPLSKMDNPTFMFVFLVDFMSLLFLHGT